MNNLKEVLKKWWPLILAVVLALAILLTAFIYSKNLKDPKVTEENYVSDNLAPIELMSDTVQLEENIENAENIISEEICAENIQDELKESKGNYVLQVNDQVYDTRINDATICQSHDENCHNRSFSINENKIQAEINTNKYNLINGCLYKNGIKALDSDLNSYYKTDFFGLNLESKFGASLTPGTLQSTFEWFRFENNNKLFIFLKNTASCGGCVFVGHYLVIDLKTEEISGKYQDGMTNPFNTILSPDNKGAITVSWDNVSYKTDLYLENFTDFSKKSIYTVPSDKAILYVGYGVQPETGAISWINNKTIAVQLFEKNIDGNSVNGEIGGVKYILTADGKNEAIKSGSVQKIEVVK